MSLLMDALKKAELEKKKAAEQNGESLEDSGVADTSSDTKSDSAETEADGSTISEKTNPSISSTSATSDDSWAFSTDEMELEPLSPTLEKRTAEIEQRIAESEEAADQAGTPSSMLKDDTTLVDVRSDTSEDVLSSSFNDDITLKTDPDLVASDFDHDATLPSERAIQSSLKDYFEASQSITMDQQSVEAAAVGTTSDPMSDTARNRVRPLDTSATHVTAHTIFTAGHTRKASTGLAKYALFGSFALALGLGAVALYYSAMTPSSVDAPVSLPNVAKIVENEAQSSQVEVDVNTASVNPPYEPATTEAVMMSDPVINEVVKEVAELDQERAEAEQVIAEQIAAEETSSLDEAESSAASASETQETPAIVSRVFPPEGSALGDAEESQNATLATQQASSTEDTDTLNGTTDELSSEQPAYQSLENEVVTFAGISADTSTLNSAAESLPLAQTYSAESIATSTLEDSLKESGSVEYVYKDDAPIHAVPAELFEEGLAMPQRAIKITRSGSKRQFNDDLLTAYHAYQQGDFIAAKTIYRQVLSRRPDNRDAHLGLAAVAVVEAKLETAYQHYLHLLKINPRDPIVNAAMFNLQGQSTQTVSESQLKMLLDQYPQSAQVHFSLGSFYAKNQRWPEAQQAYFDAFAADNTNPDYAYNLAVSLDRMEQSRAALDYYRQALKLAENQRVSFNTSQVLARIQKLSGTSNR